MEHGGYRRSDLKYLKEMYQEMPKESKSREAWRQLQKDYADFTYDEWNGKWIPHNKKQNKQKSTTTQAIPKQLLSWHNFLKANPRDNEPYREYLKRMSVEYKTYNEGKLVRIKNE